MKLADKQLPMKHAWCITFIGYSIVRVEPKLEDFVFHTWNNNFRQRIAESSSGAIYPFLLINGYDESFDLFKQ
jgi:hypothetical protein